MTTSMIERPQKFLSYIGMQGVGEAFKNARGYIFAHSSEVETTNS